MHLFQEAGLVGKVAFFSKEFHRLPKEGRKIILKGISLMKLFLGLVSLGDNAMTFTGESYIRYRLKGSFDEPSRSISLALRTTEPEGTLVFAAGQYDYTILEVCNLYLKPPYLGSIDLEVNLQSMSTLKTIALEQTIRGILSFTTFE